MEDKKFNFWQKWLTWANVLVIGIGFLVAFAGNSIFFEIHNHETAKAFYNSEALDSETLLLKNWLFGIIGGTIVGFHLLMVFISENAFKNKEKWSYYALWAAMIFWFVIDSSLSIYYGASHNVILINLPGLIMVCIPLVFTRKTFFNKQ